MNPVHKYKDPGTYIVKLVSTSDKGCVDSVSKFMKVNPSPTAVISAAGPTTVCEGDQVVLYTNVISGDTYQWLKDGYKIASNGTNSNYFASLTGQYYSVITTSSGCSDTSKPLIVIV